MNAEDVSRTLNEIAVRLELKGENPYRVRAYENAARAVKGVTESISELVEDERLGEIRGVGKGLAEKIQEYVRTGSIEQLEELRADVPDGLVEMTKIEGLGPKRVRQIWQNLNITTIGELEYACKENRLAAMDGFGEKLQQKILKGIEFRRTHQERHLVSEAWKAADEVLSFVRGIDGVGRAAVAGSIRRGRETVGDMDIIATAPDDRRESVMDSFREKADEEDVVASGSTKSTIRLPNGISCDLRLVEEDEYAAALMYFTGSKEHNTALRGRAQRQGHKLNEYGLFRTENDGRIDAEDEADIYETLGLAYIEPELREDAGEIEAAENGSLPELVELDDIRGIIHVHTVASDGSNELADLVEGARDLGADYLGICDHSQSAAYAGGLSPNDVRRQWDAIDQLNDTLENFVVLKGIETDILTDGSIDYDDELLEGFDFVIASVHSGLSMSERQATDRLIAAMEHPAVSMLGHPTGRLLLAREGYPVDLNEVIDAAAERGVAMEINASPHRLDLDWTWCRRAKERGVRVSINPDAHSIPGMRDIRHGVAIARKGWLSAADVLNTGSAEGFLQALQRPE